MTFDNSDLYTCEVSILVGKTVSYFQATQTLWEFMDANLVVKDDECN
jgi:hypothetical protein